MLATLLTSLFLSKNRKDLKRFTRLVQDIHRAESGMKDETLDSLQARTIRWKAELALLTDPREIQQKLDRLLPDAFATVKQAARLLIGQTMTVCGRPEVWNMIPYDTQLIAGIAMHQGKVDRKSVV